ncbi:MAG: creatininase family protein [Actinomycetota bacterium]|nr:creatininase family protein [Actinomycetota bacterium]
MNDPRADMDGLPRTDYGEHTWLELRELAKRDDIVVVIPTATLEDHGYHLPIDTDVRLIEAICRGAVSRFNAGEQAKAMLFPTAVHGYTPHHLDFPGTVSLRWNVFVESLLDCGRSLCRHGFDRILIINGHGSNAPLVDIAARLINLEHRDAVCMASTLYLTTPESSALIERERDSGPGGLSHACELETSLYLAIAPELVQMDKARREIPEWNENVWNDWPGGGPLSYWPHWSGFSHSGVMGDPTVATAEKGRLFLERAQEEAAGFIAEVSRRTRTPGEDRHQEESHARR